MQCALGPLPTGAHGVLESLPGAGPGRFPVPPHVAFDVSQFPARVTIAQAVTIAIRGIVVLVDEAASGVAAREFGAKFASDLLRRRRARHGLDSRLPVTAP